MMKLLPLLLLVFVCSCAPLTEDEKYERDVKKIEAGEKYQLEEAACKRRGGVMVYQYFSNSKRKDEPDSKNIKSARCETSIDRRNLDY